MTMIHSLTLLLAAGPVDLKEHLPDQLKQVIELRQAKTSQVEWTVTWMSGEADGMAERLITRTAGDAVWESHIGDENGFRYTHYVVEEDGRATGEELTEKIENLLIFEGRVWTLYDAERPSIASAVIPDDEVERPILPFDFGTAGMAPLWSPITYRTPMGLYYKGFYKGFESATYSSRTRGHLQTIVAEFEGGTLEWDLDHSKEGQPVRAAYYRNGRLLYESRTEVTQIGGRWFPARIWFYREDIPEPIHLIEVQKATFDEPWHMQEIRPEDIGILFGTQLIMPDMPDGRWKRLMPTWDGARLLTGDEHTELVWGYGVDPHPRVTAALAESFVSSDLEKWDKFLQRSREIFRDRYYRETGQAPWLIKPWKERDDWDEYVEAFIKKHKFDERRTKKAKDLLHRAKQLRDYHKRNNADEIAKARRENKHTKVKHLEEAGEKRTKQIFDMLVRSLKTLIPKDDRSPADDRDPKRPE